LFKQLSHVARKVGEKGDYLTMEQEMRARTLMGIIRGLLLVVTVTVVALMIIRELGYDIAPLIAGAGIVGIAIGFGAQTLVRDLIGGFFVLLEGQFYVGDVVHVGLIKGKVEAIKLRTTLVRDGEGVLNIIPNGEMRVVSNLTKGWSRVVLDIPIDYREDLDKVMKIIGDAASKVTESSPVSAFIIDGPEVQGVEGIEGTNVIIRLVARTVPFKDPEVAREMRRVIVIALRENKIAMGAMEAGAVE
jgi:small conductance mechanosensitive channel